MGRHRQEEHKKPKSKFFRIVKYTVLSFVVLGFSGFIFFFSYLMGLEEWREFDPEKIAEMQQTLLIYDRNGLETAALYNKENRVYITIDCIPDYVKNAFIAIEDERFYEHHGIDLQRIIGSFIDDLQHGDIVAGGSTISQQLIKNTCLTGEETISRKLQEAVMAYELEQAYTKDQILEMYLNYIYFGNGAYGIEAAAKVYFGTTTDSLTVAQAAMLAGAIKGPTHYAPHNNMEKSIKRRNLVLYMMAEQGYITEKEKKEAQTEPVVLCEDTEYRYGYFTDLVLSQAEDLLLLDSEALLSSGYRIYTTLDQQLQSKVETVFEDSENFPADASDGEQCQSAFCILDSRTSEIRAIYGGRDFVTRRGINRVVDMKRQPGSTIKPVLVYAPAIEKLGMIPTSLVLDEVDDFNGYVPKNYSNSYRGWVTLREALASSLNLPAVRTLEKVGVQEAKLFASNVGIPFDDDDNGLTLALGGFTTGVTPLSLCNAFTPFSNGGYFSNPSCIVKIEDASGHVIYQRPITKVNVMSDDTAFLITSMLQSAVESGTARRLYTEGVPIAAKTGTSGSDNISGNKDAWTVAYNPDYTMCCWMGFDSTDEIHCLDSSVTGGTFPAQLIKKVFDDIYERGEAPDFLQPRSIVKLNIDKQSLQDTNVPLLATSFTPADQVLTEYFKDNDAPTAYTAYWVVPTPPDDFDVTHGDGGYPVISFTPNHNFAVYRIMRFDVNENMTQMIGEYEGGNAKITFSDFSAQYGHTYQYYAVPIHPEIEIKGELLTGAASSMIEITLLTEDNYLP